jgi:Quinohemoprotein amine dehydrogenase, alpha subunit domain III/NHL repeat
MNQRSCICRSAVWWLIGAALAACDNPEPTATQARREAPASTVIAAAGPLTGPAAVAQAQLPDFVAEIEQLINGAAERVIAQGSASGAAGTGPLARVAGRRVAETEPLEREFELTAPGQTGSIQATGLAFTRPWPARYDMSMLLERFSHVATLAAAGSVQYNFVRDDHAAPAVSHGLFRARLTLSGSFTGDVDLHGEIAAGKIVSLVVLTGATRLRLTLGAREPRPFVSYVSTVVGTGKAGSTDGLALEAQLDEPAGVIVDRSGRLFIADTGNHAVREVSPNGDVSTLSTAFDEPWDFGFDGLGLLVVSDRAASTKDDRGPISRVVTAGALKGTVIRTVGKAERTGNGFPLCSTSSCDGRSPIAQMQWAGGIDAEGALVTVAQWALPVGLRMVTPDGTAMTLRSWPQRTTNCDAATLGGPSDVVRGRKGELYFTTNCQAVWVLRTDGTLEPVAGTPTTGLAFADGVGAAAKFSYPAGLVFDGQYLYLTESTGARLRRVDPETGDTLRIAGCVARTEGCANDFGFRDGPGDYALFAHPENLALDPWGDLYVADTNNHAIRLVRIANDPERRPVVDGIRPLALQQGAAATLTLRGRDLGLARAVDLGAGITTEIVERSSKQLKVRVRVAEDAETGAHTLDVATAFGRATIRDGMALSVIGERASRAQVRTIAGTGSWSLGINDIVPAEQAQFAFPGGLAAIDKDRLLVADPLEQRVRLITTKDGAARELLEIAVYEAGGNTGLAILQGIEGLEGLAGDLLGAFGVDNFAAAPREELLKVISAGLDKLCAAADSDCEYMALPWAGFAAGPGNSGGFRLGARLFLPTDVAVVGKDQFLIADTGNSTVKTVGIDFSATEPKAAPYIVANTDRLQQYPLSVAALTDDTAVTATSTESTLAKVTLRDGSSVLSAFAGVRNAFRCKRAEGDVRQPLGVPMGIATGKSGTFIADPYCATIWKLDANGEAHDIRGDLKLPVNPLPPCTDGPLVFATFGAPMDVAVQSDGTIWVADSWCHSIRVIKDGLGEPGSVAAQLGQWAAGITGWFNADEAAGVTALLGSQNLGAFEPARLWVTTVAGSPDGEAGFRDGAASETLFNAPVSIALAEEDDATYVFVSDVGNKRLRLIVQRP